MVKSLTVLIPTYNRPAALAVTLSSLVHQEYRDFAVIISDQSEGWDAEGDPTITALGRILAEHGHCLTIHKHLPRRGMAEQRQFLLSKSRTRYSLFIDDDVYLEPYAITGMVQAIKEEGCGFVGRPLIGLSYKEDIRPHEHAIELWSGRVTPETVRPDSAQWQRFALHNAANPLHAAKKLGATPDRPLKYKVAWVGGCTLYDTAKLREAGGFDFWEALPSEHAGEDVLAQLRVMKQFGGCGLLPSGAYHLEVPTTIPRRPVDAPRVME